MTAQRIECPACRLFWTATDLPFTLAYEASHCPKCRAEFSGEDADPSELIVDKPNDETFRQLVRRVKWE